MGKMITLTIDGQTVTAPEGTLVVDAAKQIGVDIPVFCYHPKLEPVGMCRMCLVEIGRPVIDRASGQVLREEDGTARIQFGSKLETACTTPISEGMVVRGMSEKVQAARREVLEFLLTSHPLDCPVCDKGGECSLQDQTLRFGPGESRFRYEEKMHLDKRVPLGELIYLDRERCIQCARCVRFQEQVVGEPVIGFYQRGRALQIISLSEPGFDSYFSGNTTDICPVGALTTADFRFGARPWEMKPAASICPHCAVGCNITFDVRREAKTGGHAAIKRVMPRQNEEVNELWICDKGRFGYHFVESPERLSQPLVREGEELRPASWEQALMRTAEGLRAAGRELVALAGGRLANEDLFNLRELTQALGGQPVLYSHMAGGDLVARMGLPPGSDIAALGKGAVILVAACDLQEEAPIWWLRVKRAAQRGATLIVANPRATKLDRYAAHLLRYDYGREAETIRALTPGGDGSTPAAQAVSGAENLVIIYGSEGLGLAGSAELAQACADLLLSSGHAGEINSGLMAAWPNGNTQGAWEMGFRPTADLKSVLSGAKALYVAGADPAGDDPALGEAIAAADFVVVQELFLSETARRADVVLPALPFAEREGSYTSGERRAQRFYPALAPLPGPRADFEILAQVGERLGVKLEGRSAALAFQRLAMEVRAYAGLSYQRLSETHAQWPIVGRGDMYYGGTGYDNHQGLGARLALVGAESGKAAPLITRAVPAEPFEDGSVRAVPVIRLYDRGTTLLPSSLLNGRLAGPSIRMHPETAARLSLAEAPAALVRLNGVEAEVKILLDEHLPREVVLVPRSVGLPISEPARLTVLAPRAEMQGQF